MLDLSPAMVQGPPQPAAGSSLQLLQELRSQNPPVPWSERFCNEAAESGDLEIIGLDAKTLPARGLYGPAKRQLSQGICGCSVAKVPRPPLFVVCMGLQSSSSVWPLTNPAVVAISTPPMSIV